MAEPESPNAPNQPGKTRSAGQFLWRKLGIEDNERELVIWGAAALALVGWSDVSMQNAAETFFLKRVGVEYLPIAFLASSILLVLTTSLVGWVIVHRWRPHLLPRVFASLGVAILPLWLLTYLEVPGSFFLLILTSKQVKAVALLVFWVALGNMLNARQAKRLFAPLIAGLTVGTIAGSFASEPLSRLIEINGLIYFAALMLGVGALMTIGVERAGVTRLERGLEDFRSERAPTRPKDKVGDLKERLALIGQLWARSGLFRLLFLTTLCSGVLGPMLYFQFSYVADLATAGTGGEQRLLALYSQLRGWMNLAILVIQLAFASRLYRHIGVPLAAALSPVIYMLGFLGLSFQMSLSAGITAVAGARVQDDAIYDPGVRILFNLFPDELKARATALLEGPVKRLGGTLGNLFTLSALAVGSAVWVGYLAFPIVAAWLVVAFILWRLYPSLLLRASAHRVALSDTNAAEELFDPVTLRALSVHLVDPDAGKCAAAIALVADSPAGLAVEVFADAARTAPPHTRGLLIQALDRILQKNGTAGPRSPKAATVLASLLSSPEQLDDRDRVLLAQALGRVVEGGGGGADSRVSSLRQALRDKVPAVQVAAASALFRLGIDAAALPDIDETLAVAVESADELTRQTAIRELRVGLIAGSPDDPRWQARLQLLSRVGDARAERAECAEALAEVAREHRRSTSSIRSVVLGWREDSDPRVRAAVMRFMGYAGLEDQAPWLVDHVGSDQGSEAAAAREALLSLGPQATNALIVEHCFGRRSTRDAILAIVRELKIKKETLKSLYEREVELIQQILLSLWILGSGRPAIRGHSDHGLSPILLRRLEERIDEGLHTALLFVTAIHDEDRVAELDDLLRHTRDKRQRAILLEALETLLSPQEKGQLMPLLEDRDLEVLGRRASATLGFPTPSYEQAARALLEDPDELTRSLAAATLPENLGGQSPASPEADDTGRRLPTTDIALTVHHTPIFAHLSTRQLVDLAKVIHEESYPAGVNILREGEEGQSMYVIVDGNVDIRKGDTVLGTMGPGDFFGEMAIFEKETRSATVSTQTEVLLLRLEGDDLLRLIEELPTIAVSICQYLSHRVQDLNSRLQNVETHDRS